MTQEFHTFVIEWENHAPTQFVNNTLQKLEAEVSTYLKGDYDFAAYVGALSLDSDIDKQDKRFMKGLLKPEHTITMADLDRLSDIDVDDYRFQQGRIRGWGYSFHAIEDQGQVKFPGGMNQFKARAKRLQAVLKKRGHKLTNAECLEILSDSIFNKPFNEASNNLI